MSNKYVIEFSKNFKKSFAKLDNNAQIQIKKAVLKFSSVYKLCDIVKLSGIPDVYRLRSGNYRILFKKYDNRLLILLLDVKHRKEIYKICKQEHCLPEKNYMKAKVVFQFILAKYRLHEHENLFWNPLNFLHS